MLILGIYHYYLEDCSSNIIRSWGHLRSSLVSQCWLVIQVTIDQMSIRTISNLRSLVIQLFHHNKYPKRTVKNKYKKSNQNIRTEPKHLSFSFMASYLFQHNFTMLDASFFFYETLTNGNESDDDDDVTNNFFFFMGDVTKKPYTSLISRFIKDLTIF